MPSSHSSHSNPVTPVEQPTISVTDDYVVEVWEGAKRSALYYRENPTLADLRATSWAFQALDRVTEDRHGSLKDSSRAEIASIGSFMTNVSDLARKLHEAQGQAFGAPSRELHERTNTFERFKFGAWLHLTHQTVHGRLGHPPWRYTELLCLSGPLPVPSSWDSIADRHVCAEPRAVEHLAELTRTLCGYSAVHYDTRRQERYELDYRSWGIYKDLHDAVDRTLRNYEILPGETLTLRDLAWTPDQRNNPELQDSRTVINHENEYIAEEASIGCRLVLSVQESMNDPNVLSLEPHLDSNSEPDPRRAYVHRILWNAGNSFNNVVEQMKRIRREGEEAHRAEVRRRALLARRG